MNIDTNTIVPISVANQNFSKVARLVDQYGSAVIMKNNTPRYIIYEFNQADTMQAAADDDVLASSAKLMQRNTHGIGKHLIQFFQCPAGFPALTPDCGGAEKNRRRENPVFP